MIRRLEAVFLNQPTFTICKKKEFRHKDTVFYDYFTLFSPRNFNESKLLRLCLYQVGGAFARHKQQRELDGVRN